MSEEAEGEDVGEHTLHISGGATAMASLEGDTELSHQAISTQQQQEQQQEQQQQAEQAQEQEEHAGNSTPKIKGAHAVLERGAGSDVISGFLCPICPNLVSFESEALLLQHWAAIHEEPPSLPTTASTTDSVCPFAFCDNAFPQMCTRLFFVFKSPCAHTHT